MRIPWAVRSLWRQTETRCKLHRVWKFWIVFFVVALTTDGVDGQPGAPLNPSYIVRVRTGSYAGMCVGYCENETTIEAGSIRMLSRSWSDKKKYPDVKTKRRICKRDWEDLQNFISARVLAAFVGRIGCPGCADEVVEWAEVEFRDGTKKSVSYNIGNRPPAIAALLETIQTLREKQKRSPFGPS